MLLFLLKMVSIIKASLLLLSPISTFLFSLSAHSQGHPLFCDWQLTLQISIKKMYSEHQ